MEQDLTCRDASSDTKRDVDVKVVDTSNLNDILLGNGRGIDAR